MKKELTAISADELERVVSLPYERERRDVSWAWRNPPAEYYDSVHDERQLAVCLSAKGESA